MHLGRKADTGGWLPAFRRYVAVTLVLDLAWEFGQMPLYTVWRESWRAVAFAGLHCLGGDLLIAAACLWASLVAFGDVRWPAAGFGRVAAITVLLGLGYTVFSEWLNVHVRQSWAYTDLMPLVPPLGTGLSPLMQWLVVPGAALWAVARRRHTV
jgi:hypothetical protein